MPKYTVQEPLRHDGADYSPGETVEMDAKSAAPLIGLCILASNAKTVKPTASKAEVNA